MTSPYLHCALVLAVALAFVSTMAFAEEMQTEEGTNKVEAVEQKVDDAASVSADTDGGDSGDASGNEDVRDRGETETKEETSIDPKYLGTSMGAKAAATAYDNPWSLQVASVTWPGLTWGYWFTSEVFTRQSDGQKLRTLHGAIWENNRNINEIKRNVNDMAPRLETAISNTQTIGGKVDTLVSDVRYLKENSSASGTVTLDGTQYASITSSLKTVNSLCLVTFLMLCCNVGVLLAGRFLGGVSRG